MTNVKNIINMARKSRYYDKIQLEKLQEMAAHGLIIHPDNAEFLTCSRHPKKGCFTFWPDAATLCQHFEAKHGCVFKNACKPLMRKIPDYPKFDPNAPPCGDNIRTPRRLHPMAWTMHAMASSSAGPSDKPPAASDEKPPDAASDKPPADPPTRMKKKVKREILPSSSNESASSESEVCEDTSERYQSKVLPDAATDEAPPDVAPDKPPAASNEALPDAASDRERLQNFSETYANFKLAMETVLAPAAPNEALPDAASHRERLQNSMEFYANFQFSMETLRQALKRNVNWALLNEF